MKVFHSFPLLDACRNFECSICAHAFIRFIRFIARRRKRSISIRITFVIVPPGFTRRKNKWERCLSVNHVFASSSATLRDVQFVALSKSKRIYLYSFIDTVRFSFMQLCALCFSCLRSPPNRGKITFLTSHIRMLSSCSPSACLTRHRYL